MNKAAGNQYLQFTVEIWTSDSNIFLSEKKDNVKICAADGFPFLDMNMSWSPKGDLKFGIFRKKGQQLKYSRKFSTHTPGTLCKILTGVLNRLSKLTSLNPELHSKGVDSVYPDHANALLKEGLVPSFCQTMGELWKYQDEKLDRDKENDPDTDKKENRNVYFRVAYSLYFITSVHGVMATQQIYAKDQKKIMINIQCHPERLMNISDFLSLQPNPHDGAYYSFRSSMISNFIPNKVGLATYHSSHGNCANLFCSSEGNTTINFII